MDRAFEAYDVGLMLADPPRWRSEVEQWAQRYRLPDDTDRVLGFDTNSVRRFAVACDRFATAIRERSITHDGQATLTAHLAACARMRVRVNDPDDDGRSRFVIRKADTRKIDAAVAAVLALEAAQTMPEKVVVPELKPFFIRGG